MLTNFLNIGKTNKQTETENSTQETLGYWKKNWGIKPTNILKGCVDIRMEACKLLRCGQGYAYIPIGNFKKYG